VKDSALHERRSLRLVRFVRDKTGAAALEFAMVAAPFLALLVAIIEVGVDFLLFSQIDYATHKAAQEIRSGSVQVRNMTVEELKTEVLCPKLNILPCAPVNVNVVVIRQWDEWGIWSRTSINPAAARWCPGGAADTVLLQVAYPVPLASMIWAGSSSNANGVRYYMSSAGFTNDPFGLPAPATAGC
jgi:Flp pilus assembly pilin Flp